MRKAAQFYFFMEKWVNRLSIWMGIVAGYSAALMAGIVTYDVVMRFYFRKPTMWVLETSEILLIIIIFCGAAYCLFRDGHVHIDLITSRFPRKMRDLSQLINGTLSFLFCLVLTWSAWRFWWPAYVNNWHTDSLLSFPLGVAYFFLAAGLTTLTAQYFFKVGSYLRVYLGFISREELEGRSRGGH
jgi:TRAP-type C4-dicarboxylate transport system permease small subunit